MQRVEYQPLIAGREPVDEPKSCHYSFQDVTFVISLVVQLCVLIFSLVTLGIGNPPPLLQLILVLETVVQGVEFLWYLTIGALYFFRKMTFGVEYRYIDWVITTPVMLVTLMFLVIYFHFPCLEVAKLVDFPGFGGLLALIILADWGMLFLGCMVEANWWNVRRLKYVRWLLALGFVPLCVAFIPHVIAATERPSDSAVAVVVPTFVLWSLYGVVAIAAYGEERARWRNAFYNILDLLSKNLAGVVVSIIAFEAECVAAAAEEPSLLASAMSAIGMTDASPPAAPPPPPEADLTTAYVFIGILAFVCVCGPVFTWYYLKAEYENNNDAWLGGARRPGEAPAKLPVRMA